MKITRDNYETFFLDYLEGNLEEGLIDQFLDFLDKNPDLKEELHLFENIQLPREKAVFKDKESLYKPALAENESFELKAVAYMEGDLKDKERLAFIATLDRNPHLQKDYSLFEKTRLTADTSVRYPQKEKLYRKSNALLWLHWSARVAAMLVMLMGIYTLFQTTENRDSLKVNKELASVKEPLKSPEKAINDKEMSPNKPTKESADNSLATANRPLATANRPLITDHRPLTTDHRPLTTENPLEEATTIPPRRALLQEEPVQMALAVPYTHHRKKINNQPHVVTLDQYLATKAKKATNEGVLSVHRLLRLGLNVASELSGDRLGYTVRNGKVASLEFESRLLAFELPLEKK